MMLKMNKYGLFKLLYLRLLLLYLCFWNGILQEIVSMVSECCLCSQKYFTALNFGTPNFTPTIGLNNSELDILRSSVLKMRWGRLDLCVFSLDTPHVMLLSSTGLSQFFSIENLVFFLRWIRTPTYGCTIWSTPPYCVILHAW